jgi:hypothetical protein
VTFDTPSYSRPPPGGGTVADRARSVKFYPEATWALDRLVDRSQRRSGVRLQASFARGDGGETMLANLLTGGRGGTVRLKLYLTTVLLAGSKYTHKVHGRNTIVDVAGATWAKALALPDPDRAGARRIADAQNQLAKRQLIQLERRAGQAPKITLLHPLGSGGPWVEPGTPYIGIPLELWTKRWIWCMSGKELAVLIAILDLCGGRGLDRSGGPQALSGTHLRHYGMSEDTWRIASAALEKQYRLIRTDREVVRVDLESPRLRKRYKPVPDALSAMAPVIPTG